MFPELPADFSSAIDAEADSVLLWSARCDSANRKSYLFRNCRATLVARTLGEIPAVFAGIEAALRDGYHVAGFLSYECGAHFEPTAFASAVEQELPGELPLAWFGVYESPVVFDHSQTTWPESLTSQLRTSHSGRDNTSSSVDLKISLAQYRERVERIKRYIETGDTYQVNFTTAVRMPYPGSGSALLTSLLRNQPVCYGALLNLGASQIVSASPELFFRLENGKITTQPMKGTAARGRDIEEDAAIAAWLARDEKNRSENVMIVDLLRNDLGRICVPGSIEVDRLFEVERFRTLFQMTSTISGQLRAEVDFYQVFKALFPSGSIVGAPKVRTMQILEKLEGTELAGDVGPRRRGIYTGAIGFISPEREAVFNVAIRTLVVRDGVAEMGVGSGIVYDSDAEAEYEECRLKAAFLTRMAPEFDLIETMLWDGDYFLLSSHLERLAASADYFDFSFSREEVLRRLQELKGEFAAGMRYRIRLLLARQGEISITSAPLEAMPQNVSVTVAEERVSSGDAYFRHKTTHRGMYDQAYREALEAGFADALFLNERDDVAECAIHNVFIEKDGRLLTPPVAAGALPGVYRRYMLESRANAFEGTLTLDDLRRADRIFLCNSVRGVREVEDVRLEGNTIFSRNAVLHG